MLTAIEAGKKASAKLGRPVGSRQILAWIKRGIRGRTLPASKPLGYYLVGEAELDGFLGYLLAPVRPGLADPIDQALFERHGI